MPSLRLEDHVFRIAEHQSLLMDHLNEQSAKWNWDVDLAEGRLTFTDAATGRALLTCPTFLLCTKSDGDNTLLWGWANPSTTQSPATTARWEELHRQAAAENTSVFSRDHAFALNNDGESMVLAIAAAGALGSYTFYAGGYSGGAAFLAVDSAPDVQVRTADALRKVTVITTTIQQVSFNHRAAALAYLGQPTETTGDMVTWEVLGASLAVRFDAQDRIANIKTVAGPDNVAPRPQAEPKQGLFKRLFGG